MTHIINQLNVRGMSIRIVTERGSVFEAIQFIDIDARLIEFRLPIGAYDSLMGRDASSRMYVQHNDLIHRLLRPIYPSAFDAEVIRTINQAKADLVWL